MGKGDEGQPGPVPGVQRFEKEGKQAVTRGGRALSAQKTNRMVVVFIFSKDAQKVLLQRKTHPQWQNGRYNGVGGHCEEGESALHAARRETLEETQQDFPDRSFELCVSLRAVHWSVVFFRVFASSTRIENILDKTQHMAEVVGEFDMEFLPAKCISNLHWLIPLMLDEDVEFPVVVNHKTVSSSDGSS